MEKIDEGEAPEFSIIIPAYNAESFLPGAVRSVQNQTLNRWELIIVENGSTDNTSAVSETYICNPRIRLLHSEKGVSNARNAGIAAANGEWLIFLDADDLLLNDALQKFDIINQKYAPDLMLGEYEVRGKKYPGDVHLYQNDTLKDFLKISLENPTQKCNTKAVAFRNSLVKNQKLHFEKEISYAEDSVFFLEAFSCAKRVVEFHLPVYQVIYHPGSAVHSGKNLVREYLPAIHKVRIIVEQYQPAFLNLQYAFVLNQLLVIFVNDIFARRESWREQIRDAREAMNIQEYEEAIEGLNLSDLNGPKKTVAWMMKKKILIGILLTVRIRQAQNKKKEKELYV